MTSLSCDSHRSLIVAGLGDGSIRVYDRRLALSEWYGHHDDKTGVGGDLPKGLPQGLRTEGHTVNPS